MLTLIEWPSQSVLEANKQILLSQLHKNLREYEARYELPSKMLEAELAAGKIKETHEVCNWLMDYHTLLRLEGTER